MHQLLVRFRPLGPLGIALSLFPSLASAAGGYHWKSVDPTAIHVPVVDVGLKSPDGLTTTTLYHCGGSTEAACQANVLDQADPVAAAVMSAVASVPPGTYGSLFINHCMSGASGYTARVAASATIANVRVVTTASGVIADPAAAPLPVSVAYSGCVRTYALPSPVTVPGPGPGVPSVRFIFDPLQIAWMARGTSDTQWAWMPTGCTGTMAAASTSPFLCMAYPDIGLTFDTGSPAIERYRINGSASFSLYFSSTDQPLGGVTRRFYKERHAFTAGFAPDTPVKTLSRNADGTLTVETFGYTATGPGTFRAESFLRGYHSGTFRAWNLSLNNPYEALPQPGASGSGPTQDSGSTLPSCSTFGNKPLTQLPFSSASVVRNIEPLGFIGAPHHLYPTDHLYFWFNKASSAATVNLYAPGAVRVTRLGLAQYISGFRAGQQDYLVNFAPCLEVRGSFGHVASLEGALAPYAAPLANSSSCYEYDTVPNDPGSPLNEHVRRCQLDVSIDVPALTSGSPTLIGKASGPTAQQLDLGMTDTRASNPYVIPSRVYGSILQGVCPLDFFVNTVQTALTPKLGLWITHSSVPNPFFASTQAPPCGTLSIDSASTAQGLWVQLSSPPTGGVVESDQLALTSHYVLPDRQTFGVGTTLPGVVATSYHFWAQTGPSLVNRRFDSVMATGGQPSAVHCYETAASMLKLAIQSTPFTQSFLLRKNANGTLTVEGTGATPCGNGPWAFGPNAKTYKR